MSHLFFNFMRTMSHIFFFFFLSKTMSHPFSFFEKEQCHIIGCLKNVTSWLDNKDSKKKCIKNTTVTHMVYIYFFLYKIEFYFRII